MKPRICLLPASIVFSCVSATGNLLAQTTYDWKSDAPDGNWKTGADGARWWPGDLWDEPGFGILRFNNNHQLNMTNNVTGTYATHGVIFGVDNTSARTLGGNAVRFFDNSGADPFIRNESSATHIIDLNLEGDGDAGDPLKIQIDGSGGLTFNGTINNQGSWIDVVGTTTSAATVTINGVISGAGGLYKGNANTTLVLTGNNTYTGRTIIEGGIVSITADARLGAAPGSAVANQLEINGGTLRITAAGQTLNANRGITLGSGGGTIDTSTITGSAITTTIGGVIAGNGPLTLKSTGNMSASGGGDSGLGIKLNQATNTFTGDVTITSGLVSYAHNLSFGNAANKIILNGGGLLDNNVNIALARDIEIQTGGGTFRGYGSTNATWSGAITGSGNINRTDGGTITLSGNLSGFGGTYNNQGGTTQLTGTAATIGGNWIVSGGSLKINSTAAQTLAGSVSGAGTLDIASPGGLTLTGAVSVDQIAMTGTTSVWNIVAGNTISTKYINLGNGGSQSGRVFQTGGTVTVASGGTGFRIGHWTNNANPGSLYNLSGGILDTTALSANSGTSRFVNIGWDGQGDMIVGGGVGTATLKAFGIQLDASGNGGGSGPGDMTLTLSANGIAEIGAGGVGAAAAGDRVTLNGGTLRATADGTWAAVMNANTATTSTLDANGFNVSLNQNITGDGTINLSSATGSVILNTTGSQTVSAVLNGSTAISKTGTGTTTLSGAGGTHSGTITVNDGRLNFAGTSASSVSVVSGKTLGGEGTTTGSVTLAGAFLNMDPLSAAGLTVGGLTLTNTNTLRFDAFPAVAGGPVNVLTYTGSLTGTLGTNLVLENASRYRNSSFVDTSGVVTLDIQSKNLTWNGTTGGQWDVLTSSRWNAGEADQFAWGDAVTFDNSGVATAVAITGELRPASVTVTGTQNYTITGSTGNFIGGIGSLLKSGSSTLTVNAPNTFSGGTTLSQGSIVVTGVNNGLGTGAVTLGDAGTGAANVALLLTNGRSISNPITVSANGTGTATLGFSGTGGSYTSFDGGITLGRNLNILAGTTDRLHFGGNITGTGGITITGGQRVTMSGSNSFSGNLSLSGTGTLFQTFGGNPVPDSSSVDVGAGAIFQVYTSETIAGLNGTGILRPIAGKPTLTVGGNNSSGGFGGTWVNDGSDHLNITKIGTGTQTFSGTATSPGALTISAGTVTFAGTASFERTYAPGTSLPNRGIQGVGTLRTETGANLTLRRSGDGFTGAIQVAGGTLTLGHSAAVGTASSIALQGGTLAFANNGSYFTPFANAVMTGGTLTTDITTTNYGTMHNTTGDVVPGSTTHAYHGKIYLTAGDWSFAKRFDDQGSITINGTTILNNATWDATATATFNAAADGWYDIDVRVQQGSGGVGPSGGWTKGIGIKQGAATTNQADYTAFADGALGTRLVTTNDITFARPISVTSASIIDTSAMVGTPGVAGTDGNGSGGDLILTGALSGAGNLSKTGSGSLLLNANNGSFTGNLIVNGGVLRINNSVSGMAGITVNSGGVLETNATNIFVGGHGIALPASKVITVNGGTWVMTSSHDARIGNVTLRNGGTWTSNRGLSGYDALLADVSTGAATVLVENTGGNTSPSLMNGSGGLHLQGSQNFNVGDVTGNANTDLTVSMRLDNAGTTGGASGAVNKLGAGTMHLTATNTYTGGTTVNQGVLSLGAGGASGVIRGVATVNSGATLRLAGNDATGYNTGADRLHTINVNGGTLEITTGGAGQNQTLGNAAINLTGGSITMTQTSSNLDFFAGSSSLNSLASSTTSVSTGGNLSIRQNAGLTITTAAGTTPSGIDLSISSVIASASGFGSAPLIKQGLGILELTGANLHTGGTTVNQGTLLVNNSSGSGTGTGSVTIASAATLGGHGALTGAVNVSGVLSPGASIGSLATGSLTLENGSSWLFEADASDASLADLVSITGDFTLNGMVTLVLETAAMESGLWNIGDKLSIASYTGTLTGTFSGFADQSTHTFGLNQWFFDYADTTPGSNFTSEQSGSFVTMTLIPEPSTGLFAFLAGGLLLRRNRPRVGPAKA